MIYKDFIQKGSIVVLTDRPYGNCYFVLNVYKHRVDIGDYVTGKFIMQVRISDIRYVLLNVHSSNKRYVHLLSYLQTIKRRKGIC